MNIVNKVTYFGWLVFVVIHRMGIMFFVGWVNLSGSGHFNRPIFLGGYATAVRG